MSEKTVGLSFVISLSLCQLPIFTYLQFYSFVVLVLLRCFNTFKRRSQWPRGLRRGSAAVPLLGLRVRILPGAWMFVSCERCVF